MEETFSITLLVVDEAHCVKNPEAKRTAKVKAISTHTERLLFMTGTALENRVEEMISLIEILQPELALKIKRLSFLSTAPQFQQAVAPVYYRRKRQDVLTELPQLIEKREWCNLSAKEEKAYVKALLAKVYAAVRQVSFHMPDITESSKAARFLELVYDARDEDRKAIVFSFFLDTIRMVSKLLGELCMEPITGAVLPQHRQEIIDEFDKAPAGSVLVTQIQSGGTGLNIQSASVVILCEPQLKPSIENQAISRAYRMGQTRNAFVHRLLCDDTIDEKIMDLLEEKQQIFDAFADKSAAAAMNVQLDEQTMAKMVQEEIARIKAFRSEVILDNGFPVE